MTALALSGRDLVIGDGGDYPVKRGVAKVTQDIRCALLEPLGNDRFHPGWGSTLDDFVGLVADEYSAFDAQQEVYRVILNYMAVQQDKADAQIASGNQNLYSYAEIVAEVKEVTASLRYDTVAIEILLENLAGNVVTVNGGV